METLWSTIRAKSNKELIDYYILGMKGKDFLEPDWFEAVKTELCMRNLSEEHSQIFHISKEEKDRLLSTHKVEFPPFLNSTSTFNNDLIFTRGGAALAIFCILFLPFAGCGNEHITGIEIIKNDKIWSEVKLFIILAIACGAFIFFLKEKLHAGLSALGGIVCLIIAFQITNTKSQFDIELKIGAYLAIIGFGTVIITSLLDYYTQNINSGSDMINGKLSDEAKLLGISDELTKLKDLQEKGIITQDEFDSYKYKVLNDK